MNGMSYRNIITISYLDLSCHRQSEFRKVCKHCFLIHYPEPIKCMEISGQHYSGI